MNHLDKTGYGEDLRSFYGPTLLLQELGRPRRGVTGLEGILLHLIAEVRGHGLRIHAVEQRDLLARILMHVAEPRAHLVRHYGEYAVAARAKRR